MQFFPMILHLTSRMLLLAVLSASLLFTACSSSSSLEDAETQRRANNLSEALRYANEATVKEPENASAHLLKAEIIERYSRNFQPNDRRDMYADMVHSLGRAVEFAASDEDVTMQERADEIRNLAYTYEREAAENVLQSSESLDDENRRAVIAHLHNARIIKPANAWSYNRLFELHYELQEADLALDVLLLMYEQGITSDRHVEAIGFFYYEKQAYEQALPYMQEAWKEGSGHLNTGRGLANTLLELNRTAEARPVLQRLSRVDGLRVETRLSYGRLLAEMGLEQLQDIIKAQNHPAPQDSLEAAQETLESAKEQLEAAYDLNRDHFQTNYVLGLFHHNEAFALDQFYDSYPFLEPEEHSEQMRESLYSSLSYLELAVEEKPDEKLWKSLYNAYVYLDMRDDATRAGEKIGLP